MMAVQAPPSLHHDPPVIASGIKKNHPNGIPYQYSSDHTHVAKSNLVCDIVAPERGLAVIPGPSLFKCCIRRHLPRLFAHETMVPLKKYRKNNDDNNRKTAAHAVAAAADVVLLK